MSSDDVTGIGRDPDLLEAFYREHVEAVQRFVARRVTDPHTAADLTTQVFLAVIDAAAGYDPARGAPRAWLFGIARHVVAGEHRRARRQRESAQRWGTRRDLEPDAEERATERLDAERDGRRVLEQVSRLPEGLRAVVELVLVDGLDLSDAADALGITVGNARVRLHRGRRRLAASLLPALTRPTEEVTT
ncbi:ECF RNA polymerase sigma factor SigE [Nocardioides aquaticus]|uniref:ECF RNA polymerase sigma factor SigE n=1 Tax=Nocardioides aquaticus TaxID=160826 RepID=A0ABX8EG13_9ACTN|nr:RNA polymerase sigma factor [Nocardioides aquaticus]QVT79439.1 ECF RNA polymerase sigma factor SigE [Nocardioides aquaticus]